MRKIFACIVALMVCAAMVLPVAAATFTPSVTNKPAPNVVPFVDPDGNPVWAEILEDGVIIDYIEEDCLVITSVAELDSSEDIPDEAADLLREVYEKLKSGEMKLPYDKLGGDKDNMVIRDLFDASFLCGEGSGYAVDHPDMLEPDGVVIRLTFDLGVAGSDKIHAMTYIDGEWHPAVKTVNNGDGTVTVTFEELCPVVFVQETAGDTPVTPPSQTGDPAGENMIVWIVTATVSLVAIAALVVVYRVKFSKK